MKPEGSLPYSQEPSTGSYPESKQSSLYHPILAKNHFNIIHPPTSLSSYLSLSYWLSHQYPTCSHLFPHSCYMPCQSHPPWLDHFNFIWRRVKVTKLLIMQFGRWWKHDLLIMCSRHVKYVSLKLFELHTSSQLLMKVLIQLLVWQSQPIKTSRPTASILILLVGSIHNMCRHASTAKS
jgi:hypothetical protein